MMNLVRVSLCQMIYIEYDSSNNRYDPDSPYRTQDGAGKGQFYDKNGNLKLDMKSGRRETSYNSIGRILMTNLLDSNSDPESGRTYSVIETITEEYESEDSQGNKIIKKRKVQVKKKYKTVDGKLVEKVRGTRRVKKRSKYLTNFYYLSFLQIYLFS